MLSQEFVHTLHTELQTIAKHGTVLLGGSYVYGEPTSHSDVDFFIICPTWATRWRWGAIRAWKQHHAGTKINIMVVSRLAFKCGWYYVYGRTVAGELVAGPFNQCEFVMITLKLAYFNYVRYQLVANEQEKTDALQKIAQKIAILEVIKKYTEKTVPPLGTSYILRSLDIQPEFAWVNQVLEAKAKGSVPPVISSAILLAAIEREYEATQHWQTFSWSAYVRYNLKFLPKGKTLFLFGNPGTIILTKIRAALQKQSDLQQLYNELRPIIFPVTML